MVGDWRRSAERPFWPALLIFSVTWLRVLTGDMPAVQAAEAEAIEGAFREAVSLWASERFETLWERGDARTREMISKEEFVFRMRDRALRPACCFRQVQELTVKFQTPQDAFVEAKMGFDSRTRGTTLDTILTFYLRKEEGEWRVAVRDFLRLPDETLHRFFLPRADP
ncbi:MAG: hypothetical protein ACK4Z6_08490 [Candidatus Methylomirabilales bacterium]